MVYLDLKYSGLGLKSITNEVLIQYIRKGLYLMHNKDIADSYKKYLTLKKAGYRTPIGDFEYAVDKIGFQVMVFNKETISLNQYIKNAAYKAKKLQQAHLLQEWANSCHYGKLVMKYYPSIEFPSLKQLEINSCTWTITRTCAEEQVHGLITNPLARKMCRRGCKKEETAYHVISACLNPEYTRRHDFIVFWIIKYILYNTCAPEDIHSQLNYGKASIVTNYAWNNRMLDLRAGTKIITNNECYHNRPDVVIHLTNPDIIYILEISVAHLQNIEVQEQIKHTRYGINSKIHVTDKNLAGIPRDFNIVDHLKDKYKCPVKLGVIVIGALGEILKTRNYQDTALIFEELNINEKKLKNLLKKCSSSASMSTTKIILNRLKS